MRQKKITAWLLTVSMILTMVVLPQISFAAGTPLGTVDKSETESTGRGDIVYTYLGTSKAINDDANYENDPFADAYSLDDLENKDAPVWEEGGLIWIGIQLENMTRLKTMFNTDSFSAGGNGNQDVGLGSLVCGLAYDTDYFSQPACEENNLTVLTKGNYPTQSTSNATALYSLDKEDPVTYASLKEGSASASIRPLSLSQSDDSKIEVIKAKANTADGMTKARKILMIDGAAIGGTAVNVSDSPMLMFAIPLKMKGSTAPAGKKVIEGYFDKVYFSLAVGTDTEKGVAYDYELGRDLGGDNGNTNLNNRFNIKALVDIFPAGANDVLDSLTVKTAATKNLNSYVEGNKFDPTGLVLTPHKAESGNMSDITGFTATNFAPSSVGEGTLKFYIDTAGKTAETIATTREITKDTALATTDSTKHVYAVYTLGSKTAIADLGEITVAAKSVSSIELDAGNKFADTVGSTNNTFYTTDNIASKASAAATALRIKINYDNNTNAGSNYPFGTPAAYSLYRVDANGKLELVGTNTKFNAGTNTFYVAENGKAGSDPSAVTLKTAAFSVTGTANVLEIQKTETPVPDAALFYDANANIDFSNVELYVKNTSDSNYTKKKVSAIGTDKLKFYYADTNTSAAYDAAKAVPAKYTTDLNEKYVFVVPADNTSATPVLVGQLGTDGVKTITAINNLDPTSFSDGDKLGDAMTLSVTNKSGKTATLAYNDFAGAGITMKIDGTVVDKDREITVADKGKTIDFFIGSATTAAKSTAEIEMGKVKVNVIVSGTPSIAKTYDSKNTFDADDTITVKVKKDDLSSADQTAYENIEVTGLTFKYEDKNVGNAKKIVVEGTPTTANTTFNANYSLQLSTENFETANNVTTVKNVTGAISKADLKITAISKESTTQQNTAATADVTKTGETADQTKFTTDATKKLYDGDKVTITYDVTFAVADVKAGTNQAVDVTVSNVAITGGDDKDNYNLTADIPTAKGKVVNRVLDSITVDATTIPTDIEYPTNELPNTIKVIGHFKDGVADAEVNATFTLPTGGLKVGENTVTATYEEGGVTKTTTFKVNVAPKKIQLSDITFSVTKQAGSDTVTENNTIAATAIVNGETVTVKAATYTFDDETLMNDEQNVTVAGISLDGADAGNYVIVDGDGNAITAATTATGKGTITQTGQELTAEPTAEVSNKTNDITVSIDAQNVEYSKDGENWQESNVFTGLSAGTEYTLYVRLKASADGSVAASEPKTVKATTYKYRVRAFKKNADIATATPAKEFYTNIDSVASANDINTKIFDKKPSSFKDYYTAKECKSDAKVVYPMTITADTVLFFTTSGGGGGGGGVSVGLTLSGTTAEGLVGDKVKIDATVTGSTSKPTWKSSDEKVATVDNEGNIVMVGEGTATVTVTVAGISKTVKVTVGKPEATPTPTVEPTDTPIIPDDYLKPYVSGYDEGDFRPENAITRAELSTMIAKLAYGDDLPDGVYNASFWDVEEDAWYNKYIGYLEGLGVLGGYDEGDFRPNNLISRGEICAVIARAQKLDIIPYEGLFTDVTEDDWAKDYIQTLASMDIATGYEDGTFGPYNSLTRAEAVTIINRLLAPSEPVVTWTPWDISGHWAEADIMLAANERKLIGADEPEPEATPEVTDEPEATTEPEAEETTEPEATATPEE